MSYIIYFATNPQKFQVFADFQKTAGFDNLNKQYNEVITKSKKLEYYHQQIKEYLRQEQSQIQQKKKNNQLE